MLLSLHKRFLFLANTKCGSTTVEFALKRWCELALHRTAVGKHLRYGAAIRTCQPLLRLAGLTPEHLFRFGVIRDPVEWVVSWYNYLARANPDERHRSTVGVSFADFAAGVIDRDCPEPWAKIGAQSPIFLNGQGHFAIDYLIPMPRLEPELAAICGVLGIDRKDQPIPRRNLSPAVISVADVTDAVAASLRAHFAADMELYGRALASGFGNPAEIVLHKRDMDITAGPAGNPPAVPELTGSNPCAEPR